jgi:hypothetical protein
MNQHKKLRWAVLAVVSIYLFVAPQSANAQASVADTSFFSMTKEALKRYAADAGLDVASSDPRAYGFQVEKHGGNARVGFFDISKTAELQTHLYGCQFEEVATCWKQRWAAPLFSSERLAKYSASLQLSAVWEVIEKLKATGVDAEKFSLLKVWQSSEVIHLRIGFEAGVVEMNYDCDPTKQKMCRPATEFPENEP